MKSERSKVLHRVAGRPMIEYPIALSQGLGAARVVCVLGHQLDEVRAALDARFGPGAVTIAEQREQRGTGHALLQAAPALKDHDGLLLVLYGDTPLLRAELIAALVSAASARTLAIVTTRPAVPTGYGRIVRDRSGRVQRVVEERDCSARERKIEEVNAGIYCGPARFMLDAVRSLKPDNAQGELYLTDLVALAAKKLSVATVEAPFEDVMGVNDRVDLARVDRIMRVRLAEELMRAGVTVRDPEHLWIEPGVTVGRDSEIGPGVELAGRTRVGSGCKIEAGVVLRDATVGDRVHIKPYCVVTDSAIGAGAQVGPWAHLRPGSELGEDVHLGNFVETKKARLGRGAKANHLSYLGDAVIGERVNVGCGTITCNYDGYKKYQTIIEDGAFIGSDTQLVAPVTVGAGAVVGAGTTVYRDVSPGALALTRVEQKEVPGYAERKRKLMTEPPVPPKKIAT